ncbi:MAG TPA: hypothetical protein ENG34_00155 [Candidatus Aenigmarchaeota archaeon]|nr:hypothetical protein [Candidatus Aenigmarchaeota archaeon]
MEKESKVFTREEIERRIKELERYVEEFKRKYPEEYKEIEKDIEYSKEYLRNLIGKEKNLGGAIKAMEEFVERHKFTFKDFPTISTVSKLSLGKAGSIVSSIIGRKLKKVV